MGVCFVGFHRYALLGAASFLGGSMRMTVSLCVIMVEITNNLKLLPLIMLVLLISKVNHFRTLHFAVLFIMNILNLSGFTIVQAVGDAFNEGFYEEQARLRGIPLLESRPKYQMRSMTAKDACRNQKVDAILLSSCQSASINPIFNVFSSVSIIVQLSRGCL